ncbi:MAG: DUF779 domain-containing protein [Planctomycetota bacterium]
MCYPKGEFRTGNSDVLLGEIDGCEVYIGAAQFELWKHTALVIDAVPGRGASFLSPTGNVPHPQPGLHPRGVGPARSDALRVDIALVRPDGPAKSPPGCEPTSARHLRFKTGGALPLAGGIV